MVLILIFDFSDIDECDGNVHCDFNATCFNTIGSYKCFCDQGFRGDGTSCQPVVMETFKDSLDKYLDYIMDKIQQRFNSNQHQIDKPRKGERNYLYGS